MRRLIMLKPRVAPADTRVVPPSAAPRKPKVSDPFYSSAAWIALRDRVRREAKGMCEWPGCRHRGRWVDHKKERRDGGAGLDRANCWLLCSSHHQIKTAAERRRREASGGFAGSPAGAI